MREMIDAGAAGVHFEDQLSSAKKCGHMGGKVLVPMQEFITKLIAARLAADVCGVPTVLCARTDADSATLLTSDIDRARSAVPYRRADRGRLLPHQGRLAMRHRPRIGLRPVLRFDLVRNFASESGRGGGIRRIDSREVSRQAAGVQLLALVQLAEEPG